MVNSIGVDDVDVITATMTAELSDVYFSKKEGVHHIINILCDLFEEKRLLFLDVYGNLLTPETAKAKYLTVAAANWYAIGWLAAQFSDNCIAIDMGSTSTSVVPVLGGKVRPKGLNDLEKLMVGELIYTGALRTNIISLVSHLPFKGKLVPVSSEYFAQTGDIHLLLGNISERDYIVDTPDGRGITRREASARLARVICGDLEIVPNDEIIEMARYIYRAQIRYVAKGLSRFKRNHNINEDIPVYVMGLGGNFVVVPALKQVGYKDIRLFSDYVGIEASRAAPSFALALMGFELLEGGDSIGCIIKNRRKLE
jgi:hypothetical protein